MSKPKRVGQLLTAGPPTLQALLARAAHLAQLTRQVRATLPAPLNQHCSVANIKEATLIMTTDGAAWATLLRYQAATVLDGLRGGHNLTHLRELRVKITPPMAPLSRLAPRAPQRLSEAAAAGVASTADYLSDPALAQALRRLTRQRK